MTVKKEISRQRVWQLKMRAEGRCPQCGDVTYGYYCPVHQLNKTRQMLRLIQRRRSAGQCAQCGRKSARYRCARCREYHRNYFNHRRSIAIMGYSLSEAKRVATQMFGSYENLDGIISVRAPRVRDTFGPEKYARFLNWMSGQTRGVAEDGETLYYFDDILRFERGLPVID